MPAPAPALPQLRLPEGSLVGTGCLTRVQESGTCGKVPDLQMRGGIQRGDINSVGFSPQISLIGESGSKGDK